MIVNVRGDEGERLKTLMKVNDNEPPVHSHLNGTGAHVYMSVTVCVQWLASGNETLGRLTFTLAHCDGLLMDDEQG